ncbi:MAG TPA: phosphoadenylyl-sulfate reductase [Xanthobacteraceae bacterium]|nr:phosphoadenylyl-sulfate reductase [Xanthobacteraceae bacterium]
MNANLAVVTAAKLNSALADADPSAIVTAAVRAIAPSRLAVASSFGIESATLLKIVADVDPSIPVLFLDTEWLFPETLSYRETLVERLGLRDVRTIKPAAAAVAEKDPHRDLWSTDPDACCHLRKVEPLSGVLENFDGWINGRKRYQGGERASIPVVEAEGRRLKFNPLARSTPAEIAAMFRDWNLPLHPLAGKGFSSVGCIPCTRPSHSAEAVRAGRWADSEKTECGIHNRMPLIDGAGI